MAIPNIYFHHNQGNGAPQVFELVGGISLSQIGSDIATGLEATGSFPVTNSILEFKGKRYCWHNASIYEENTGGSGNWGVVRTLSGVTTEVDQHSGLHLAYRSDQPIMIGLTNAAGGSCVGFRFDGSTWTEVSGPIGSLNGPGKAYVHNNVLYQNRWGGVHTYDPATDTLGTVSGVGGTFTPARDFCSFNGKLYAGGFTTDTAANPAGLFELQESGFVSVGTMPDHQMGTNGEDSAPVLFSPDNESLVLIISGETLSNVDGDQAFRIQNPGTGSQTITNITDPVIPAQFRPGGASAVEFSHYYVVTDTQNSSSPTSPDFYFFRTNNKASSTFGTYQWQGYSTTMSFLGIGPSWQFKPSECKRGGQGRLSAGANATSTNKVYAELETPVVSSTLGGMDISFRVYGTDTGLTATVYFSLDQETPDTQATLVGTVSGGSASRSGNTITNVTADDGATLYTFTWAALGDGASVGIPATLVMDLA
jgi:hypothetical protein